MTAWSPAKRTPPAKPGQAPAPRRRSRPGQIPNSDAKRKEQEALATENKLEAERLTQATNAMRAEITRLKMERELMTEKLALETAKRQAALKDELAKMEAEKEKLAQRRRTLESPRRKTHQRPQGGANPGRPGDHPAAERYRPHRDHQETRRIRRFQTGLSENPLKENGTLVISDRRIPLNGLITTDTADYITSRIQYWNNKDRKLPIFIVIDASPGGSVMAGYRILKAMESSDAPVHVVVKSFAASMAAAITTLATESYAYPNAVILHHQISSQVMGQLNLTQQREFHEESQRWWARLGTPIATKMGITTDELIKTDVCHITPAATGASSARTPRNSSGSTTSSKASMKPRSPRTPTPAPARQRHPAAGQARTALAEEIDANGKPFAWLPRLDPKDVYFLYNPDGYYRMR